MGTLIKSDVISTRNLGSLLERTIPKENLSGFFDFGNNKYSIRGNPVALGDFLSLTRNSAAQGLNKNKELITYGVGAPRFHLVESVSKYGLALGDNMKNYFLNSNAPATQDITFAEGTDRRFFLLVRVIGTGSVAISGAGVTPFTVNGGEEKVIKMTSGTNTITVTKSGSPTYVQVSRVTTPYGIDPTRTETAGVPATKSQDVASLNPSVNAQMFTGNKATFFFKFVTFDGGDNSLIPHTNNTVEIVSGAGTPALGGYVAWLKYTDGTHGKLFARKQQSGAVLEESPTVDVPINKINIVAIRLSAGKADVFMNGVFSKMAGTTASTLVEPYLYRLPFLQSLTNVYISPNMIITNMVAYDKEMSDSEITDIYNRLK